jgi:hypothetical protein
MVKAAELAKKEAAGDYSHLKNKKGELVAKPLPQPTLPNLSVDDYLSDASSVRTRGPAKQQFASQNDYYSLESKADYPPMPAYNQPYSHHQAPGGYPTYNPSAPSVVEDKLAYDDDTGSTAHLALDAAPFGHGHEVQGSINSYDHIADPHDVYYGGQHKKPTGFDGKGQRLPYSSQPNDPYSGVPDYPPSHTPAPQYEAHHEQQQHDYTGRGQQAHYGENHNDMYGHYTSGDSRSDGHGHSAGWAL